MKVCDIVRAHPEIRLYKSIDDLDIPVDGIWISTPTKFHVEAIIAASNKTKHIYCEKPIASTPDQVNLAYTTCAAKGVSLHCGWMRRRDPGYQAIKQYLDKNSATIVRGEFHSFDWPIVPPEFLKTLGSIFTDLMCHDFNLTQYYMNNKLPKYITAHGVDGGIGIWDSAVAELEYANGSKLVLTATRNGNGVYDNSLTVLTSDSKILDCGREEKDLTQTFMARHDDNFRSELPYFANIIKNNLGSGDKISCINTAVLITAATRSANLGGKRIPIIAPRL